MKMGRINIPWFSKIYTVALAFLGSIICHGFALSISLNDFECVSEFVLLAGGTISGNFVVIDHDIFWNSDHPGIEFTVTSPGGDVIHSLEGTSGDKFEVKAPQSGIYKFCFNNPAHTPETISFHIHIGHIPKENDLPTDEHLNPIYVKIVELKEALESVISEQKYLKARNARHRHTNESTRKRVVLFTIMEYVTLGASSALQVVYIRRLFIKSYAYNRV